MIGAGLAGAAYALHAEKAGLSVHLLSLGGPNNANSDWAQGGIIFQGEGDSPELLAKDIEHAGDGLYLERETHWNPAGNRVAGETIYDFLESFAVKNAR